MVAALEEISDTYLDPSLPFGLDNVLVSVTVLFIGIAFAFFAFRRIDALTGALRVRNAELEVRTASARALSRVAVAIAAESGLDHVLGAVVTYARELLAADVAVLLLEGPDGQLGMRASSGLGASPLVAGTGPATPQETADGDAIQIGRAHV